MNVNGDSDVDVVAVHLGVLHAGGYFSNNSLVQFAARWDGAAWTRLGFAGYPAAFVTPCNGSLFGATDTDTYPLSRWNGTVWERVGPGMSGGGIYALLCDQDGGTRVYATGAMQAIGNQGQMRVDRIAVWDGATWAPVGAPGLSIGGTTRPIGYALAHYRGALVVGGLFTSAGNVTGFNYIAAWVASNSSWVQLGTGLSNSVYTLVAVPAAANDDDDDANPPLLYAGGVFATAGGLPANRVAVWDGVAWAPLGAGVSGGSVNEMAWFDGALYVVGTFTTAGDAPADGIARWDGAAWADMRGSIGPGYIHTIYVGCTVGWTGLGCAVCAPGYYGPTCTPCTVCEAAGVCTDGLEGRCDCRPGWTGALCDSCLPGYFGPSCTACATCEQHGRCTDGRSGNCTCDLGWTGEACTACATGFSGPGCTECAPAYYGPECRTCELCEYHGVCREGRSGACDCQPGWSGPACLDGGGGGGPTAPPPVLVYLSGQMTEAGGVAVSNIAEWDGTRWNGMAGGTSGGATTFARAHNGAVYVGGPFTRPLLSIGLWSPAAGQWAPLGGAGQTPSVASIAWFDGQLVVGGRYDVGSLRANVLTLTDAGEWVDVLEGQYAGNSHESVELVVAGTVAGRCALFFTGYGMSGNTFRYAYTVDRWDGRTRTSVGTLESNGGSSWSKIRSLFIFGDALYVGGVQFGLDGGWDPVIFGIARWDGATWSGTGLQPGDSAWAMATFSASLYAAGSFSLAGTGVTASLIKLYRGAWIAVQAAPSSIAVLSGDAHWLYAAGSIYYPVAGGYAEDIVRFNGTTWEALSSGPWGHINDYTAVFVTDVNGTVQEACTVGRGGPEDIATPAEAGAMVVVVLVAVAVPTLFVVAVFAIRAHRLRERAAMAAVPPPLPESQALLSVQQAGDVGAPWPGADHLPKYEDIR